MSTHDFDFDHEPLRNTLVAETDVIAIAPPPTAVVRRDGGRLRVRRRALRIACGLSVACVVAAAVAWAPLGGHGTQAGPTGRLTATPTGHPSDSPVPDGLPNVSLLKPDGPKISPDLLVTPADVVKGYTFHDTSTGAGQEVTTTFQYTTAQGGIRSVVESVFSYADPKDAWNSYAAWANHYLHGKLGPYDPAMEQYRNNGFSAVLGAPDPVAWVVFGRFGNVVVIASGDLTMTNDVAMQGSLYGVLEAKVKGTAVTKLILPPDAAKPAQ